MLLAFVLGLALGAHAAEPVRAAGPAAEGWPSPPGTQQWPIWPREAPDQPVAPAARESMSRVDRVPGRAYTAIANVATPTMTVFRPRTRRSDAAIVVFPGGGFRILAIDIEGTEICDWVTRNGMTCVLLKYRVPGSNHYWDDALARHVTPRVPFALQDAQRTIRLVRSRARALEIDPRKVGVIGFSAGGYLVAQVSNTAGDSYRPVDAADALGSRPDFAIALYPGHLCRDGALDPGLRVATPPPTFLLQAWDDPVDPICNGTLYANALAQAGAAAEVHLFARGGHAFGLRDTHTAIDAWPALVLRWLGTIDVLPAAPPAR